MSVVVEILYGESRQATLVPLSAMFTHPNTGEEGIYVIPFSPEFDSGGQPGEDGLPPLSPPMVTEFRPVQC